MADWCARHGVLHLLLAHHREDQAETVLLNLTRGSGVDGLAGMSAIAERPSHRLLRPLLSIPKARLERTLSLQGQDFIKDASNSNAKFKRVRIRQALPALAKEGASVARLVKTADRMAQARAALEGAATCLLASSAAVYPEGYARVEIDPLLRAPSEVVLRALARLVTCIGGKAYPPRLDRLQRCYQNLLETGGGGFARTLGGCRIIARAAALYICREIPRAATSKKLSPYALWDGRFFLWAGTMCDTDVRPLSAKSAPFLRGHKIARVPAAVRYSLPSVLGLDGTLRLPHFKGVCIQDCADNSEAIHAVFQPLRPLSSAPFWNGSGMNRP
jgi:tRNA(Ile)-lysidine synthase